MVDFVRLYKNYPDKDKIKRQCTNKQKDSNKPFNNYCAILLSECLIRSGVKLNGYKGKKCWSHAGDKHALLAEELAERLDKAPIASISRKVKVTPGSFQDKLKEKTGIVFFKDYWQRGSEPFERRSGDHIDLWNKDEITSSSMWYRGWIEWLGFVSDLNKSKQIWFWEIK